jgi:hypothetical protein
MIHIINAEIVNLLHTYNNTVSDFQKVIYFPRDINIQKDVLEEMKDYFQKLSEIKALPKLLDSELNLIAFFELLISALISELEMIINLKENDMNNAWISLIKAQTDASLAANNNPFELNNIEGYINKLQMYEQSLFPELMFCSVGGIIKKAVCSICKCDYDDCDHMKGKLYNGNLCLREIHEMDLEEVSIVKNPASKLSRILTTEYKNETVDVFTFLPHKST